MMMQKVTTQMVANLVNILMPLMRR